MKHSKNRQGIALKVSLSIIAVLLIVTAFALWRRASLRSEPSITQIKPLSAPTVAAPEKKLSAPVAAKPVSNSSQTHAVIASTPPRPEGQTSIGVPSAASAVVAEAPASTTPTPTPTERSAAMTNNNQAELLATTRMYTAHASLRTPEESDPDSTTNQQILQSMVMKSLAHVGHSSK